MSDQFTFEYNDTKNEIRIKMTVDVTELAKRQVNEKIQQMSMGVTRIKINRRLLINFIMDLCKARQVQKTLRELIQYQVMEDEDLTQIGFVMLRAVNRAENKAIREQEKWKETRKELEKEKKNGKNR